MKIQDTINEVIKHYIKDDINSLEIDDTNNKPQYANNAFAPRIMLNVYNKKSNLHLISIKTLKIKFPRFYNRRYLTYGDLQKPPTSLQESYYTENKENTYANNYYRAILFHCLSYTGKKLIPQQYCALAKRINKEYQALIQDQKYISYLIVFVIQIDRDKYPQEEVISQKTIEKVQEKYPYVYFDALETQENQVPRYTEICFEE
ncbi:hypothetical protein [uncultured Helicobacter sp.]|uniref:hypothetical protein n=1 Tax=uncultured Helicobacter sp. TaxID=175537 RepID=UPI00374EFE1B